MSKIQKSHSEREDRITELEKLWKDKTGQSLKAFDEAINKKFEVKDGRDALSFASMKIVKEGLLKK
jgi:hypothetical protein